MLSTLPAILNGHRDSITRHNMPGSFTYFAFDKCPSNSKLEVPKYNIWNTAILCPDPFHPFASDIYSSDMNLKHSSNNQSCDAPQSDSTGYATSTSTDSLRNSTSHSPMEESSSPLSKSLSSSISSNEYDSLPPSSNDDASDSYDSGSDSLLPSMEVIIPYKRLDLAPSCFLNGCVCGHHFEFRDMAYESRKRRNSGSSGVTIRPKTPPISAKLRCCAC